MDQNPGQDTNPPEYNTKQARKAGITAFVGTTIEWFDFYIYGTASALVLGPLFFPDASPAVGTLAPSRLLPWDSWLVRSAEWCSVISETSSVARTP